MALQNQSGENPQGQRVPLPVSGIAASTTNTLGPGETWASDIIQYNGNDAVLFAIQSDVAGSYNVEYYSGTTKLPFMGNTTNFDPAVTQAFQGALAGKGDGFRLVYTNGPEAQGSFFCEIRFAESIQPTFRSVAVPVSGTNLAETVKAVNEGREDGAGGYKQTTVTSNGQKVGQDVFILNPPSFETEGLAKESSLQALADQLQTPLPVQITGGFPTNQTVTVSNLPANQQVTVTNPTPATDVSLLAKDATLTSGAQKTQITNAANAPVPVAGTVTVANPTAATDVSALAKDATLKDGTQKTQVTNFPASQAITGTVAVSNFPSQQNVQVIGSVEIANDSGAPIPVSGSVTVSNLPATQPVSAASLPLPAGASTSGKQDVGNTSLASLDSKTVVNADGGVQVHIQNPTTSVAVSNLPATQSVSGTVAVSNFPATQPVSGTITVANTTFPVTDNGGSLTVDGTVNIGNLPATQPVSGSVSVTNFPASQAVTGTVNVGNFPASQAVTLAAIGSPSDPIVTDATQTATLISLTKGLLQESIAQPTAGSAQTINLAANVATNIPANANGKGRLIFSVSGTILIAFGFTATATLYSVRIVTNQVYEVAPLWSALSISVFATAASTVNVTTLS